MMRVWREEVPISGKNRSGNRFWLESGWLVFSSSIFTARFFNGFLLGTDLARVTLD